MPTLSDIAAGVTVRSDFHRLAGGGEPELRAGSGASADPTAMLVAGPASGAPSSAVSVYADGFGIDAGPVRGTDVRPGGPRPCAKRTRRGGRRREDETERLLQPLLGGTSVTVLSETSPETLYMAAWLGTQRRGGHHRRRQGPSTLPPLIVIQAD